MNARLEGEKAALYWVSNNGREPGVKLLLANDANVNARDDNGIETALDTASSNGEEAIVKLLLEKGVYVDSRLIIV